MGLAWWLPGCQADRGLFAAGNVTGGPEGGASWWRTDAGIGDWQRISNFPAITMKPGDRRMEFGVWLIGLGSS